MHHLRDHFGVGLLYSAKGSGVFLNLVPTMGLQGPGLGHTQTWEIPNKFGRPVANIGVQYNTMVQENGVRGHPGGCERE